MIHFLLTLAIVWLTYKTITRGQPNDDAAGAAGLVLGLLFGVVSAFSFIAGGWWSLIGYAIIMWMLASWIKARSTIPADIERDLAEYEAMKPELDALREESMRYLKPHRLPLP